MTVAANLVGAPECGLAVDDETEEDGKAGKYAQPDPERRYGRPLWRFLVFPLKPTPISPGRPDAQDGRQEYQTDDPELPEDVGQIPFQYVPPT